MFDPGTARYTGLPTSMPRRSSQRPTCMPPEPGGTSGWVPARTRSEVFHFLAEAAPAWISNWVQLMTRRSGGSGAHEEQWQTTRCSEMTIVACTP
jgi:hypothetical protein